MLKTGMLQIDRIQLGRRVEHKNILHGKGKAAIFHSSRSEKDNLLCVSQNTNYRPLVKSVSKN